MNPLLVGDQLREANQVTFEQRTDEDASIRKSGIDSPLGIKIFPIVPKTPSWRIGFRCKWRIATNEGIAKRQLADDYALLFRMLSHYCRTLNPIVFHQ
jgi:hypothetical protein